MKRTWQGTGSRRLSALAVLILAACGGGGGDGGNGNPPPGGGFTTAMISGRAFYREVASGPERGVTTFAAAGTFVDRRETFTSAVEESGTWSIDASGKLLLSSGGTTTEVTLVAETSTSLDVTEREGGSSRSVQLRKLPALDSQTLVGRHLVEGREIGPTGFVTGFGGVIQLEAGGTGAFGDGIEDKGFSWQIQPDGSARLTLPAEVNVFHRVATASGLRVVGEVLVGGVFDGLVDVTLSPTVATSGFSLGMVEGRTFYWEDPSLYARTLLSFSPGGSATEWYEENWIPEEQGLGWSLGAEGSLYLHGPPGWNQGLLLLEETAADFDVLWFDEFVGGIGRDRLRKTVPLDEAAVLGTWGVGERDLDETVLPLGTLFLQAGGGGDFSSAAVVWSIGADGALVVQIPALGETYWLNRLPESTANQLHLVGVGDDGVLFWTEYLILTRQ